ncbi:GGDEF domain-containing protein [Hamadaea tsunoensis]|uniref:GGDEF domain-containing protein n=1 Tax=Hamadaea tsunoensis TaxID=53368 RepID=UPI0004053C7D|nr:GGDEF domain-containing protein [Hamadaea tsunoensis]
MTASDEGTATVDPFDPVLIAAAVTALAVAAGAVLWSRRRIRRVAAEAAALQRRLQAEWQAARQDPVTGLPNRRALDEMSAELLAEPEQPPLVAVLVVLDDIKKISTQLGRAAADQVLVALARRFADYAPGQLVARMGDDEFVGLLANSSSPFSTPYPDERELARMLAMPIWAAGHWLRAAASVGIAAVHPSDGLPGALRRADAAVRRGRTQRRTNGAHPILALHDPTHDPHAESHRIVWPAYCSAQALARRRKS